MSTSHDLTLSAQPDTVPGDVVVVLQQKDHAVFRREGPHLFMKKDVSLVEALTGFEFVVNHLDGRTLLVKSPPNTVIKPGEIRALKGEGMPVHKNPYQTGNLYLEFTIQFPEPSEVTDGLKQVA